VPGSPPCKIKNLRHAKPAQEWGDQKSTIAKCFFIGSERTAACRARRRGALDAMELMRLYDAVPAPQADTSYAKCYGELEPKTLGQELVVAKIQLFGRVYPGGLKVNLSAPGITYTADDGTLTGTIDIAVKDSAITVDWRLSGGYKPEQLLPIWTHSKKLSTVLVDLIAYRMGAAAIVILDSYTDDNGHSDNIAIVESAVTGLSTSFQSDAELLKVFALIASEQPLMLVFDDLIATLSSQDHKTVNCGRCVEAIRQLVAGYQLDAKQQWPIFNNSLNLDRSYPDLIMKYSKDPRHGKQTHIDPIIITEVMRRTWVVIDRFFHFRLGGNGKLDLSKFPILKT